MANLENSTIRNRLHIIKDANLDGNLDSRFEEILMGYQLYNISKLLSDNIIYGDNYANSVTLTGDHTEILARKIKRNDGNILISAQTGIAVEAQEASISRTAKKHIEDKATDEYYSLTTGTYISETATTTVDILANSTNTGIGTNGSGNAAMKLRSKGSMYITAFNETNADVVVVAKRHILAKAGTNIDLEAAAGSYTLRAQTNISETATTGNITRAATAGSITDTAKNNYSLTAANGSITESAGTTVSITGGTGISETATTGNITRTATAGAISDTAGTSVTIKANNGTLKLNSAAKDVDIYAKTNLTEKADGNYSLTVAGTTTVSSTGNVSISSIGDNTDVTITAKRNMLLQAQNGTNTLKGYSTVKVESTNADLDIDSKTSTAIDAGTSFSLKANNGTGTVQSTTGLTLQSTTSSITENAKTNISRTAGYNSGTGNITDTANNGSYTLSAGTTVDILANSTNTGITTAGTGNAAMKLRSKGSMYITAFNETGADIVMVAKDEILAKAGNNINLEAAAGSYTLRAQTNISNTAGSNYSLTVGGTTTVSSTGNVSITATGNNSTALLKSKADLTITSETGDVIINATTSGKSIKLNNNVSVAGTLGVTGNTSIGGTLGVTGDTTVKELNIENGNNDSKPIVDVLFPVGAIYMSINNTNPGDFLPKTKINGTWTKTVWDRIAQGRTLIGVDENSTQSNNFKSAGNTGGEYSYTHLHDTSNASGKKFSATGNYTPSGSLEGSQPTGCSITWPSYSFTNASTSSDPAGLESHSHTLTKVYHTNTSTVYKDTYPIIGLSLESTDEGEIFRDSFLVKGTNKSDSETSIPEGYSYVPATDFNNAFDRVHLSSTTSTEGSGSTHHHTFTGTASRSGGSLTNGTINFSNATFKGTNKDLNITISGSTENTTVSSVQPYYTCYMWKRRA